jgi:hypothetical protein
MEVLDIIVIISGIAIPVVIGGWFLMSHASSFDQV